MDSTRLFDLPLCVIDVETTGASFSYGDRMVEIGVVRLERGAVAQTYQQLLNPGRPISGGASAVTGISNDMLIGQPAFGDVWPAVKRLIQGAVLVGHNVGFDIGFFDGECRRLGESLATEIGEYALLDTVRIARRQFGRGGNGLQKLAARLEVAVDTAHRALADCHTTARVLEKMLHPHGGWDLTLAQALALQGGAAKPRPDPTQKSLIPDDVAAALIAGRRVVLTYLDAASKRSERTVTPMFVRRIGGAMTLVAQCHLRNERRMFKLSRILAAVPALDESPAQYESSAPELAPTVVARSTPSDPAPSDPAPADSAPTNPARSDRAPTGRALLDQALSANLLVTGSSLQR